MQGLVHCGICPTSVLLRGDKSVCLCDMFHCFDATDERSRKHRHRAGALDYMPPEMILSEPAADEENGPTLNDFQGHPITPAVDVWQVRLPNSSAR